MEQKNGVVRMKKHWAVMTAGFALVALFAGCATPPGYVSGNATGVPDGSGFLQDYALLRPVPGREGRYIWALPDAELRRYTRFIFPPMEIWIDRDAQYRGLSADVVQRLAAIYQASMRGVLAPGFSVVNQPGPGVASCRFAITGVTPERPGLRAVDVVPIKAAFNLVRGATGTASKVARVSAEIECQDSVTGRALMAGVITGVGEQRFLEGQPITYAQVESVLNEWAQDFRQRLNAVHGG
jgi:hypothetical protein